MSNPNEWTCTVCGKSKELTGDHLKTKKEVRSDCWPCGTKRLFKKGGADAVAAAAVPANPTPKTPTPTFSFGLAGAASATTTTKTAGTTSNPFLSSGPTSAFSFGAKPYSFGGVAASSTTPTPTPAPT
eukprot:PhM_4_TR11254/c0_g1_i4/m.69988